MINNNLDYEKNSNHPALTTSSTTHLATSSTTTTSCTTSSNNHNSNTASATMPSNDNSYFNRFDNRIAANLAAVLNGARFRSSSCSNRSSPAKSNGSPRHYQPPPAHQLHFNLNNSHASLHCRDDRFTATKQFGSRQSLNNSRPSSPCPSTMAVDFGSGGIRGMGQQQQQQHQSQQRRRPLHLFTQANFNCNDNEKVAQTPSSDEDNSPTELNNCKRLTDKPPLVKRLTMGLLRTQEDSRPLVNNPTAAAATADNLSTAATALNCQNSPFKLKDRNEQIYSNGYINEDTFEPEKLIASKFGDSCRRSLTAIPMLDNLNFNDNSEFNLKKRYLRETSSANSSPKIFANRLRVNTGTAARLHAANSSSHGNAFDDALHPDEDDLKEASWFQAGISRDIAVEVLSSKSPGAFLVRKSSSKPGCYALTLRVPSPPGPKIANYIILRTQRGYKIKGFRKEFSTLKALITHHSVMPELLPVPLAMPRPTNMSSSRRNLDDFDTYDSLQMLVKYLRAKNMETEKAEH